MRRGIVLSLDPKLDTYIRRIWGIFEQSHLGIIPGKLLETPHITIAEATSSSIEPLWQAAIETQFDQRDVHIVPFGAFLGKKNIIYYNVIPSEGLLKSYLAFYNLLKQKKAAYNPLYDPSHILFHCTIAVDIETNELPNAIELISKERESISGCVANIEFWEHFPTKLIKRKELAKRTKGIEDGILPND